MLFKSFLLALVYTATTNIAAPIRREVPQEHSHENILITVREAMALNNPQNLGDAVFGLLGNAAAAQGLGDTTDANCLQQAIADQSFTNGKAANNVTLMTAALIYRALERNTGSVGLQSNACTTATAVNPEIAAIQQHQDPASDNAAATNKAIVLELAKQIASVGGNPQDALGSGTFAPGDTSDTTGKGNGCDNIDPAGCINTLGLLVEDATADEINAAVAGVSSGSASSNASAASGSGAGSGTAAVSSTTAAADSAATDSASASCAAPATVTVSGAATASTSTASAASNNAAAASGQNLQTFTGALGGSAPPAVTPGGRGFQVAGQTGDFINVGAALQRSCSVQHNACANAANSGAASGLTVGQCDQQDTQCNAAAA